MGDRVLFTSGTHGAAAEEYVMQADSTNLHPLPAPLSFSQGIAVLGEARQVTAEPEAPCAAGAGFLMGYTTAYHGLVHRGQLKPGEWLLVTGGCPRHGVHR